MRIAPPVPRISGSSTYRIETPQREPSPRERLKLLFPKEGVPIVGMAFAGVANAPHPNAARLFANWVFTKEGQDVWQKAAQGVSVRTDVTNYAAPYLRIPAGTPTFTHTWETLAQEQDEVKAGLAAKIFGIK